MSKQVVACFFLHCVSREDLVVGRGLHRWSYHISKKATIQVFRHDPRHAKGKAAYGADHVALGRYDLRRRIRSCGELSSIDAI